MLKTLNLDFFSKRIVSAIVPKLKKNSFSHYFKGGDEAQSQEPNPFWYIAVIVIELRRFHDTREKTCQRESLHIWRLERDFLERWNAFPVDQPPRANINIKINVFSLVFGGKSFLIKVLNSVPIYFITDYYLELALLLYLFQF